MKKILTLLALSAFTGLLINSQPSGKVLPQLGKDPVSKVISAMTLEEKVLKKESSALHPQVKINELKPR